MQEDRLKPLSVFSVPTVKTEIITVNKPTTEKYWKTYPNSILLLITHGLLNKHSYAFLNLLLIY